MPYIKPFVSRAVDWTPLKNLNTKFTKFDMLKPKDEDMWQFTTFLVDKVDYYEKGHEDVIISKDGKKIQGTAKL